MNTFTDDLLHAATWGFVLTGMLWTIAGWCQGGVAPIQRFQLGLLATGWGTFNLPEGVIDHQVLGVRHVRDDLGGPLSWDLGFLAFSAVLLAGGWAVQASGRRAVAASDAAAEQP